MDEQIASLPNRINEVPAKQLFLNQAASEAGQHNEQGELHGIGRRMAADGSWLFEGQFEHGKLNGWGRAFFANGSYYVGHFRCNKRHGEGKMVYANGKEEEGMWRNGKLVRR